MTAAERLWDSLNYSYGQQRDESNRQYARAVSQNDQAMLNRGMQRSTYALQTSANLRNQAVDASNRIYNQQIADYENRLQDIENQEWQRAFQEKSFDEGVRQFNVNFDYQKGRDAIGDEQWQKAFDQSNTQNDRQLAYNYVTAILARGGDPTDDLLARAGLSRQDANAIKAQQATGGGGGGGYSYSSGGGRSGGNNDTTNNTPGGSQWSDYLKGLFGSENQEAVDKYSGLTLGDLARGFTATASQLGKEVAGAVTGAYSKAATQSSTSTGSTTGLSVSKPDKKVKSTTQKER